MDSKPRYAIVEKIVGRTGNYMINFKDLEVVLHKFKLPFWVKVIENL